ncbi:MAG: cohesin domain-containing protein, partial [Anaerolineae bacterium]|nr:cohesin domain-containing protein [Anaerolineae bacterium]
LSLAQGNLYAADLAFTYDSDVVTITTVAKGDLIPGWSAAVNTSTPGVVRVAIAGATPVQTSGELLELSFRGTGATGESSPVTLTQGDLNEGAIPAEYLHGTINVTSGGSTVYLPCVIRATGTTISTTTVNRSR